MIDFRKFHLVTGGVISALLLLVGHYFPWHKILPSGQPLDRLWAFRYGSGACWAGFAYWRWVGAGDKVTPIGLMIIYAIAGVTVREAYRIDAKGQAKTIARRLASSKLPTVKENVTTNDAARFKEEPRMV